MISFLRSERLRARLTEVFGFDTRSLAVARIALGLLVILDVCGRLVDYDTFYTEGGVLNRVKTLELYHRKEYVSLFMASGADWWAGFCFAIEGIAGLCYLLGYRTRLTGWIAWFMMIGCHARFSQVLQAGDLLLRLLLFWSFFLPMGARFSIDSMRGRVAHAKDSVVVGVATLALYFQVLCVYVYTGLLKDGAEWLNGTAVYYAMSLDYFAKEPQTSMMLEQFWLTELATHATLYLEIYGPWFAFVPFFFGYVRTAVVFAFMSLHFGFFVFMTLGLFPWISITSWIFLLPGWVWDKCGWTLSASEKSNRSILTVGWARRSTSRWGFGTRLALVNAPILLFFWIMIQWNQSTLDGKNWKVTGIQRTIAYTLRLDQKWSMFAPYPIKDGGWYMMPGKLVSGEEVDLWLGGEPKWATEEEKATWTKVLPKPGKEDDVRYRLSRKHLDDTSGTYINQRWRKYMRRIWSKKHKALRLPLGQYLCRTWNAEHSGRDKLKTFKIVFMKDLTPKPGKSTEVEPVVIWSHNCFKTPAKKDTKAKKPTSLKPVKK